MEKNFNPTDIKIPFLNFKKDFLKGFNDPYVRQLINIQSSKDPLIFSQYPNNVKQKAINSKPEIKKIYNANLYQNIIKEHAFCTIIKKLNKNGIKNVAPIKGIHLLKTLYSHYAGLRTMCDVDLFVDKSSFKKLPIILKQLEKSSETKIKDSSILTLRKYFCEDMSLYFKGNLVEIHSKMTIVNMVKNWSDFFDDSISIKESSCSYKLFSLEHMAIIFLLHDYSRSDFININYRSLVEFYVIISNSNFVKLKLICSKHNISHLLDFHMFLLSRLFEKTTFKKSDFRNHSFFKFVTTDKSDKLFDLKSKKLFSIFVYRQKSVLILLRTIAAFFPKIIINKTLDRKH